MNPSWLSIVVPVYNEAAHLSELISRCRTVCEAIGRAYELILVDDGSQDASADILQQAAEQPDQTVVAVLLNRNYGQHAAVMAGFAQARGEVMITLDADLQNPPEEIPKLLALIDDGCDVVGSIRMNRRDSGFRRWSSWLMNRAVQRATGVKMHDYGCMLRAYRRPVVDAMLQCQERSTFIPVLANSFAHRTAEVEVEHAERAGDASRYTLGKLIQLQLDLLTCMSSFPLRVLSLVGAGTAVLGLLWVVLLLTGWSHNLGLSESSAVVLAALFVFAGLQLLGMGLMGEYLGRIYNDVRARPRYCVRKVVGGYAGPPPV